MSGFIIKLIACLATLIDHITVLFVPYTAWKLPGGGVNLSLYNLGRGIGRIAFPIFCFLLVEGFFYTKSRKKYMLRLAIFALLSEPPFDLCFQVPLHMVRTADTSVVLSRAMTYQNVMWTLLIGFLLMYGYERLKMRYLMQPVIFNTLGVLWIVGASALAAWLKTDYSYVGILFILVFYLFRGNKIWLTAGLLVVVLFFSSYAELPALVALPLLFAYNGKQGKKMKYVFYAFYPLHLLVLAGIKYFMV